MFCNRPSCSALHPTKQGLLRIRARNLDSRGPIPRKAIRGARTRLLEFSYETDINAALFRSRTFKRVKTCLRLVL